MSATATTQPLTPAPMQWTLDKYHTAIRAGLFADQRVQLIEGQLIHMPPMNAPHRRAMDYLRDELTLALGRGRVSGQTPIIIDPTYGPPSEPEPDVWVAPPDAPAKPRAEETLLIIEVSDTTIEQDRKHKVEQLYRDAPEVWLFDLPGNRLDIWRDGSLYGTIKEGEALIFSATFLPDVRIDVDAVFAASRRP